MSLRSRLNPEFSPDRRLVLQGLAALAVTIVFAGCGHSETSDGDDSSENSSAVGSVPAGAGVELASANLIPEHNVPGTYFITSTAILGGLTLNPPIETYFQGIPGTIRLLPSVGGVAAAGADAVQFFLLPTAVTFYSSVGGLQTSIEGGLTTIVYDGTTGQVIMRQVNPSTGSLEVTETKIEVGATPQEITQANASAASPEPGGRGNKSKDEVFTSCQADVRQYMVLLLLENVWGVVSLQQIKAGVGIGQISTFPLFADFEAEHNRERSLAQNLQDRDCYYYKDPALGDGSVFSTFKRHRDTNFSRDGEFSEYVRTQFPTSMSTAEATSKAQTIIRDWFPELHQ